ncbi:substrate-binding domain-containing protein, partial [Streptomyces sp. NPDC051742]|uniref:substrate-binding domain-containing protein n=1 Tax=Streptomyces sp. NPDC051742 TaxID=3155169 RepID=UPI00342F025F
ARPPGPTGADWSAKSGYPAGLDFARRPEVTAVFAANDQMAMGLMRSLHESGKSVPGDVSVAGFDNIAEAAYLDPPLTTVHQDFEVVGKHCFALLLDQIEGRTGGPRSGAVEPVLVVRSSTVPPRPGALA